jgi:hypothetical protein
VSTTDYDTIRTERLGDWLLWHARNPEALDNLQARALKALKHGDEEAVKAALLDFVDACTPPVGNWWRKQTEGCCPKCCDPVEHVVCHDPDCPTAAAVSYGGSA